MKGGRLPKTEIRDRLLAYRIARGWTQVQTAQRAGISPTTIAHIETGDTDNPRRITLMRLAQAFGVSLEEFVGEAPPGQADLFEVAEEEPSVPLAPAPALQLEEMYVADAATRRRALEAATAEEREVYAVTIARVVWDVLRSASEWADIAADESKSERERRVARESQESLWRHLSRLTTLRVEATGEAEEQPQEELAEFIGGNASVGAGGA
jgi:transcriptional regulator with XRE-family HTH domain